MSLLHSSAFEPLEEDSKSHEEDDTDSDDDGGDDDDDDNDVDPDGDDDGGDKDKAQHSPTKPYEAQCSATHPFQALEPHADLQSPTAPCKALLPSLQEPYETLRGFTRPNVVLRSSVQPCEAYVCRSIMQLRANIGQARIGMALHLQTPFALQKPFTILHTTLVKTLLPSSVPIFLQTFFPKTYHGDCKSTLELA